VKIALTVEGDEFGGAEISLINLVRDSSEDVSFELIGRDCIGMRELAKRLPQVPSSLIKNSSTRLRTLNEHRQAYLRSSADLVQITLCNPGAAMVSQVAALSAGIPTIAIEQLVRQIPKRRERWIKTVISRLLVDHVAVGETSARQIEQYFSLSKNSVKTIYNGVSVGSTVEKDLGSGPIIGTVARLEGQKALHRLISAIVDLPEASLTIVGSGSLMGDLRLQATREGVADRIEFTGWVENPLPYIKAFDVFVLPSENEAFPLSIVESMLLGTPVVASDVGSVSEAVRHNQTGILVPTGELNNLAKYIKAVLNDREFAKELSRNALSLSQRKFTSNVMAGRYRKMWTNPRGRLLFSGRRRS